MVILPLQSKWVFSVATTNELTSCNYLLPILLFVSRVSQFTQPTKKDFFIVIRLIFLKYGPNPASFSLFSSFSQPNDKYSTKFDYIKALMACLGFEPGTAGAGESSELWRAPYPPNSTY